MADFKSIFTSLETLSRETPDRNVYSFADENGQIEQALTWQGLLDKTDALTGYLRTRCGISAGERVLLVYPPSIDFIVAFVACLRAGIVPVPVYPPNPMQADQGMDAFNRIAVNCDAKLVLTNRGYARGRKLASLQDLLTLKRSRWSISLNWVTTDDIKPRQFAPVLGPEARPDELALLQYTSGSTSSPKGVTITHGNLAHQLEYTRVAMRVDEGSRGVLWVPQYHDLGLIGGILNALCGNFELVLFSPLSFLKRPALWFELMHRVRATHTAAPNFAYELALRKTTPEQRASWDLSSLKVIMSAAEPVRASTMQRFLEGFRVSGLRPEAYLPAYGLAEHTLAVTFNGGTLTHVDRESLAVERRAVETNASSEHALALVSSGSWADDVQLRIVDPETGVECEAEAVGEVWVNSPSKAAGYWRMAETNEAAFQAVLQGEPEPRYLRTGDLGFVRDRQLYVCGRIKDMLILAGRNLYPQDVEDTIQSADRAIRAGGMAAFSVDVQVAEVAEEALVLLVELRNNALEGPELQDLAQKLQRLVLDNYQTPCHAIVLAPAGTVLKTTSGKVRRQACRELWSQGKLHERALYVLQARTCTAHSAASALVSTAGRSADLELSPRVAALRELAARLLNMGDPSAIDLVRPLTEQGMGSLTAVEFCQTYESESGEELPVSQFFNAPSIVALAQALERPQGAAHTSLDELYAQAPDSTLRELCAARALLLRERFTWSGFRVGEWSVRPAQVSDVAEIHRLDQQEYGWLGEAATDDASFIEQQVRTLNSRGTPWVWLLERHAQARPVKSEIVGWYILQPTHRTPHSITSWADATDGGTLRSTFDPNGKHLYIVAAGISKHCTKQAHRLMVLNALSLMKALDMTSVFACLAMPGFAEAHAAEGIEPEQYMLLQHANGAPKDAFLGFFRELWEGEHQPLRLLVDGYLPDQHSGGHGVCASVRVSDFTLAMERVFDKLAQQRASLFAEPPELAGEVLESTRSGRGASVREAMASAPVRARKPHAEQRRLAGVKLP